METHKATIEEIQERLIDSLNLYEDSKVLLHWANSTMHGSYSHKPFPVQFIHECREVGLTMSLTNLCNAIVKGIESGQLYLATNSKEKLSTGWMVSTIKDVIEAFDQTPSRSSGIRMVLSANPITTAGKTTVKLLDTIEI